MIESRLTVRSVSDRRAGGGDGDVIRVELGPRRGRLAGWRKEGRDDEEDEGGDL